MFFSREMQFVNFFKLQLTEVTVSFDLAIRAYSN